jgi:hypothetical protein
MAQFGLTRDILHLVYKGSLGVHQSSFADEIDLAWGLTPLTEGERFQRSRYGLVWLLGTAATPEQLEAYADRYMSTNPRRVRVDGVTYFTLTGDTNDLPLYEALLMLVRADIVHLGRVPPLVFPAWVRSDLKTIMDPLVVTPLREIAARKLSRVPNVLVICNDKTNWVIKYRVDALLKEEEEENEAMVFADAEEEEPAVRFTSRQLLLDSEFQAACVATETWARNGYPPTKSGQEWGQLGRYSSNVGTLCRQSEYHDLNDQLQLFETALTRLKDNEHPPPTGGMTDQEFDEWMQCELNKCELKDLPANAVGGFFFYECNGAAIDLHSTGPMTTAALARVEKRTSTNRAEGAIEANRSMHNKTVDAVRGNGGVKCNIMRETPKKATYVERFKLKWQLSVDVRDEFKKGTEVHLYVECAPAALDTPRYFACLSALPEPLLALVRTCWEKRKREADGSDDAKFDQLLDLAGYVIVTDVDFLKTLKPVQEKRFKDKRFQVAYKPGSTRAMNNFIKSLRKSEKSKQTTLKTVMTALRSAAKLLRDLRTPQAATT